MALDHLQSMERNILSYSAYSFTMISLPFFSHLCFCDWEPPQILNRQSPIWPKALWWSWLLTISSSLSLKPQQPIATIVTADSLKRQFGAWEADHRHLAFGCLASWRRRQRGGYLYSNLIPPIRSFVLYYCGVWNDHRFWIQQLRWKVSEAIGIRWVLNYDDLCACIFAVNHFRLTFDLYIFSFLN